MIMLDCILWFTVIILCLDIAAILANWGCLNSSFYLFNSQDHQAAILEKTGTPGFQLLGFSPNVISVRFSKLL